MAGAVQWTVDQFWAQLQALQNQINALSTSLNNDKAQLTDLYAFARREYDPAGAYDRAMLDPLVHHNSVLRLTYLAPVKAKFTEAVNAASSFLKSAGYTTPTLSGLGIVPALVIVPVVAVAAVITALAAVAVVNRMTQAQIARTATVASIFTDTTTTPAQKQALAKSLQDQTKADAAANPPLFDTSWIVPAAAIVAVIVLGPTILNMAKQRRAA